MIVATGASAKWLDLGVDKKLSGRGVSTCATCDGFFFKGLPVAVIGGGDTAMEEAIYLSKLATRVTVIHRRDTLRASKVMQDKAMSSPNIDFIWNTEVVDIKDIDQGKVTSLVLRDVNSGQTSELAVDGVFIGIGHVPNTALFKGQLALHDNGYLKTHDGSRTSVRGRVCGRRRAGPRLPPGGDGGRIGMHGGDRRGAVSLRDAARESHRSRDGVAAYQSRSSLPPKHFIVAFVETTAWPRRTIAVCGASNPIHRWSGELDTIGPWCPPSGGPWPARPHADAGSALRRAANPPARRR